MTDEAQALKNILDNRYKFMEDRLLSAVSFTLLDCISIICAKAAKCASKRKLDKKTYYICDVHGNSIAQYSYVSAGIPGYVWVWR